jgi:hypothetical protein
MSFINIQESNGIVTNQSTLSKFSNLWSLDISNPNVVTSSSNVYVTKKNGVNCIYISAVSGTTTISLNPAHFNCNNIDNVRKIFKFTAAANNISGTTSNIIVKYVDRFDSSNNYGTTYFSSGTYDFTTFDSIVTNISVSALPIEYIKVVLVGPCEVWISNISFQILDITYNRTTSATSATKPQKIGRGADINSIASLKDLLDFKNNYNGNLVRLQIESIYWSPWIQYETSNNGIGYFDNQAPDAVLVTTSSVSSYYNWLDYKLPRLDEILGFALRNDIKCIVDMHTPIGSHTSDINPYCTIDDTFCMHYYKIWEIIATRYKNHPAVFAYDLINEPYEKKSLGRNSLNRNYISLQKNVIDIIRKIDKNVPLIVEFDNYANPDSAAYVSAFSDNNLIYSFHTYFPGIYVASTNNTSAYPSGCYYNGKPIDKNVLRETVNEVRKFQLKYNVPIYVGEFSCYRWNPGGNLFLSDLIDIFDEYGWHWSYFCYRGSADAWDLEFNDLPMGLGNSTYSLSSTPRNDVLKNKLSTNISLYDTSAIPMVSATISATQFNDNTLELYWNWPECYVQKFNHKHKPTSASVWGNITSQSPLTASILNSATYQNLNVSSSYDFNLELSSTYGTINSSASFFVDRQYPLSSTIDSSRIYSLRKIVKNYSGNCIRIRRNSDNAETDIGFNSIGYLDVDSISAFCGTSANGYVTKWYGQINSVDLFSSAVAFQPVIYLSANGIQRVTDNGLPGIDFGNNNTSVLYNYNAAMWNDGKFSLFVVKKDTQTSANYSANIIGEFSSSSTTPLYSIVKYGNSSLKMWGASYRNDAGSIIYDNITTSGSNISAVHQLSIIDSRSNLKVYVNNGLVNKDYNYTTSGTLTVNVLSVGARRRTSDDSFYRGNIQEIIILSNNVPEEYVHMIAKNQKNHYLC